MNENAQQLSMRADRRRVFFVRGTPPPRPRSLGSTLHPAVRLAETLHTRTP